MGLGNRGMGWHLKC
ncbi:Protein of unknown function [Bacillus wiedmannii]|uniref:Uncharacterized protein n=1 Tax=Bacillus wiedmannii TaxID=1890302 RepID=A0AB37YSJ8_9BACI|nr:Protein of unknown function [Bacillus wiedmannii]